MRTLVFLLASIVAMNTLNAKELAPVPLWPNGAPGALGHGPNDIPTLTPFLPDPAKATGAAMVICPGGGYAGLAPYEGKDYALWLNQYGVAGFVLKYRLGSHGYHYPVEFEDGTRAMRWVRAHASKWNLDAHRIGIMGSSAGGHLASMVLTHFDSGDPNALDLIRRESSRPDLGILCYPVITMGPWTHQGSKRNLLGPHPDPHLAWRLSSQLQVTPKTPPCFIWQTAADPTVPVENSLMFAEALQRAGVPFALHIYERGRHGLGLGDKPPFRHPLPWTKECLRWLHLHGFVKMEIGP